MAVTYQKAVRVRGTDSDGERGEKIFAEKYNKLAKAFNDHLSYGVGDTTWRLFFYAHSSMRSMVRMKPGFHSENAWQEPTQEDAWWKIYSHIIPEPSMFTEEGYKDSTKNGESMFSWPSGNIGRFKGPQTKNPLVAYIYGTAGNTVDWFYNSEKMPPEWFRAQLVKLNIDFKLTSDADPRVPAAQWIESLEGSSFSSSAVPLVDSFLFYDPKLNPANAGNSPVPYNGPPSTLSQMWLLGKVQRGVIVPEVNEDLDLYRYKSAMTHAAAPAYMTARWYYDYYIHWRSPYGKTPPAYEPSPEIVGLCPWLDERFPPTPRYMYIFSPVDAATHSRLTFETGCGYEPNKLYGVRREYDHYLVIFWDGHYTDPVTGQHRHGNLKLPYKHYYEGPYSGGGRLTKREAEKDQMDAAINFYNSGFRKHFSANMSKEIFSKYLVETETGRTGELIDRKYDNLSEATFDVPSFGFEFESFFEKQYSLAPAMGFVSWKDSWMREDGESEHLYEPNYPAFTEVNTTNGYLIFSAGTAFDIVNSWSAPDVELADGDGILDGPYGENNFSLTLKSVNKLSGSYYPLDFPEEVPNEAWKNYCFAGYYIVGCGIKVINQQTPSTLNFNLHEYKRGEKTTPIRTHRITAGVNRVESSGFCEGGSGNTMAACNTDGGDWVEEGVFEELYYFGKGEEIVLADRQVKLETEQEITFLKKPVYDSPDYKRDGKIASNSWSGICMEMAVLLRMRPDLPDAMLMLRLASSGLGSDLSSGTSMVERWGGDSTNPQSSAIGKGLDTKGDMLFTNYQGDGTPDITMAPQKIWRNYNNYGIIKNLFGMPNLPHKMGERYKRTDSESYTKQSMDEAIAAGGEPGEVGSTDIPINSNPIYDSAREMVHRHLRMVPRTHLADYKVINDDDDYVCKKQDSPDGIATKWTEMPEVETEAECSAMGHSWVTGRTKSVLFFNRYVDMYGDPNLPAMEGLHEETLTGDSVNPNRIEPKVHGPDNISP